MTLGPLSGLADLPRWLARIREVAVMPDGEALAAADALLWSAIEEGGAGEEERDYDSALVTEQLERCRGISVRLRETLAKRPQDLKPWDGEHLRREADRIGQHAGQGAREKHAAAIVAARTDAADLAAQVELTCVTVALHEAGSQVIATTGAVQKIYGAVDRALAILTGAGGLTPELEAMGRAAKVRAARYRAQKKLEEAEVAEAGGNLKKATKLRAEAEVCWTQDFAKAFPGAPVPPLRSPGSAGG